VKKTIIVLVSILVAVFIALSILGAGGEYAAERLFYRAMKGSGKITVNPDVAPPAMIASVEKTFLKIIKKYPRTNTAKAAHISLAEFYIFNKDYDKAFKLIGSILATKSFGNGVLSSAQFLKGFAYERQGKWDAALREYMALRDNFTDTQFGIQIPMYIGKHYEDEGKTAEANAAYADAAQFYANLAAREKGKAMGYAALNFLMHSYMSVKNYEQAGRTLEEMIDTYPLPLTMSQQFPYIDYIYTKELKRPDKAVAIYKGIQGRVKDEKLIKFLQGAIDATEGKTKK